MKLPLGVLLSLVLVGVATAACSDDDAEQLDQYDVVATDAGAPAADGPVTSVTVPTGTFDLVVSAPSRQIGDQRAPDGASLVRVTSLFHDADVRSDVFALAGRGDAARSVDLQLEVDGTAYPVGLIRAGNHDPAPPEVVPTDVLVVVQEAPDDVDEVRLLVGYDGLVQSLDAATGERLPGPADALYGVPEEVAPGPSVSCAGGRFLDDAGNATLKVCRVGDARRLPYVPDLGWAEPGRAWLLLTMKTQLPPFRSEGTTVGVERVLTQTSMRGRSASKVLTSTPVDDTGATTTLLVFDVPDAASNPTMDVDLFYSFGLVEGEAFRGPDALIYTATVRVPVPAV